MRRRKKTASVAAVLLWSAWLWAVRGSKESGPSCDPLVCDCSAASVNCSGRGFVAIPPGLPADLESLDLSRNDLSATMPHNATAELARLTSLRRIDLSHNHLSGLFGGVHYSLVSLDLSYNNISSVRSLHLEGLVSLEELNLAGNKVISLPAGAFAGSPLLSTLNLRANRIVKLEPGSFDHLSNLRELILTKNRLSSFPKGLFQEMKSLEVLELNKNEFVEIEGLSFFGLDKLKVLRLKRNQIKFLLDAAFFGLSSIEELNLDRNRVDAIGNGWLYELKTLSRLSLAHNKINFIDEDAWEHCHSLAYLDLSFNRLQLLDRESLRSLPTLVELSLADNLISHIMLPDAFAETPNLEILNLDGNELSHSLEDAEAPFGGLVKLSNLSLNRNQIKSIGEFALKTLESLEWLEVNDNVISTVQEGAFEHTPLLRTIKMNSASVLCDCYLKWFPRWINETGVRGVTATCAHPENLKSRYITSVAYESYMCDDFPKPYLLKQPETTIALKGSDLILKCRAASTSPANMTFVWKLNSEILNYGDCIEGEGDGIVKVLYPCVANTTHSFDGKGREITSELRLTKLDYDDAGEYQCVVSNRFGATYSDKAVITVYVFPEFVMPGAAAAASGKDAPNPVITAAGGGRAELKCAARGVPAPDLSWSKDGGGGNFPAATERRISRIGGNSDDYRMSVNSIVIHDVSARDMGVYACTATNPAGSISWNISLSVLEVPRFVEPMRDVTVYEGETAVLECLSSGSPKPLLTWTKDGIVLGDTQRRFFAADDQKLIIVDAAEEDAGRYQCTMRNQLGSESQSASLSVSPTGDPDLDQDQRNETIFIAVIAVSSCLVAASLVWIISCYYNSRRRRVARRREDLRHLSSSGRLSPGCGGSGLGPSGKPVAFIPIRGDGGESDFDIHEHVRKGLLGGCDHSDASPVQARTTLDKDTGLLTTDLKDSESLERDSGTGDSKKSSDQTTEEEDLLVKPTSPEGYHDSRITGSLLRSSSSAAAPPKTSNVPGHSKGNDSVPPDCESSCNGGDLDFSSIPLVEEVNEDHMTPELGAGESRISLSEFGLSSGVPFADDDNDDTASSSNHLLNSTTASQESNGTQGVVGGGEGPCDVSLAASIASSSSSSSSNCSSTKEKDSNQNEKVSRSEEEQREVEVAFRTFHPRGSRRQVSFVGSTSALSNGESLAGKEKQSKSRASAVELNGECYLTIVSGNNCGSAANGSSSRSVVNLVEPSVYRGGVGTLPRTGFDYQQELLEASLKNSSSEHHRRQQEDDNDLKDRRNSSIFFSFGRNNKRGRQRSLSRGRLKANADRAAKDRLLLRSPESNVSTSSAEVPFTDVVKKSKEMF